MTTTNIKFNFLGNFADFMQLIGGHERSLGLSHELASGKNSDTLIKSITPCSDAGVQMVWEGNAQDIAEAMSNLWQHLLLKSRTKHSPWKSANAPSSTGGAI